MAIHISPSCVADLVDRDDVRVGDPRQRLGLAEHAVAGGRVPHAGLVAQHLHGDLAVELVVVGGVDDAHAARAQAGEDREAADPRRRDAGMGRRSRGAGRRVRVGSGL
jgi:hypothetical protein